jgi:lysozyme family protein
MPTPFEIALNFVLEMEGGLSNDPSDPGGLTKYGISKKAYPEVDIANLTIEDCAIIYKRDYWAPCRCDNLPFAYAVAMFDMAVNQGTGTAIKALQETFGVVADGVFGPETLAAVRTVGDDPRKIKLFLARRLVVYARLMAANQALLVFARNWFFRVLALSEVIFKNGATTK